MPSAFPLPHSHFRIRFALCPLLSTFRIPHSDLRILSNLLICSSSHRPIFPPPHRLTFSPSCPCFPTFSPSHLLTFLPLLSHLLALTFSPSCNHLLALDLPHSHFPLQNSHFKIPTSEFPLPNSYCSITRMVFHLPWENRQKVTAASWHRNTTKQPQAK
jgi:hypothetical protein